MLTAIIVFSALAIALEPLRIPMLFWPGQYFHFWEIPVIIAFLLYGLRVGFVVTVVDALGLLFLFPDGTSFMGPIWRVIIMSVMFFGLLLAKKVVKRISRNPLISPKKWWRDPVWVFTVVTVLVRLAILPVFDLSMYRHVLPIVMGISFTDAYLIGLIPVEIVFNILVPLYSVPVAYVVSKTVNSVMKLGKDL